MKKMLRIVIALFLLTSTHLFAKDSKIKLGDVPREEIEMEIYAADSSAPAVILNDLGDLTFQVQNSLEYSFKRIVRIKILTKEGLDYANFFIPQYDGGSSRESLRSIKGFTYNITDGKVEKTKLDKESIHREQTSDSYETTKITFPNVQPGSVIELEYTIISNLFGKLRGWNFQSDIPVRESEYTVEIPEYFTYRIHSKGYEPMDVSETSYGSLNGLTTNKYHWKASNMPAFKDEPFMLASDGYIAGLDFELSKVNIPGSVYKDFSSSWQSVKTEMTDEYQTELNGGAYLKDAEMAINVSCADNLSKTKAAFEYIQQNMKWNERYGIYPAETLRKAFNDKEGNCADINLMLVVLLNRLGIESYPVLVCSRGNGILNMFIPKITAFDYMVAVANVDGQEVLLDATDAVSKCGDLPFRCLNMQGLKIAPWNVAWVELMNFKSEKRVNCNLNLSDLDNISGQVVYSHKDYSAYLFRKETEDKTDDRIIEDFEADYDWILVDEFKKKDMPDNDRAVSVQYDCEFTDIFQESGDMLYVNPIVVERQKTNPFTLKERKYPVDFGFSSREDLVFIISLPEGYKVETLPEPIKVVLPEDGGSFTYLVQESPLGIQVLSKVEIKRSVFVDSEYAYIKELFDQIVKKQSEMIVLKKQS
ncbi:DUF3857 domain-containing protein [Maribellus sediminis]|uniref:DUF3857 domain-containing protein n=1 Tax=Maribellus sediminis TaxID=2696285 RepID=UPI001431D69F|nr:DUF3857 domain-containing transglutaminase family protein [Maribellus sediminis]